MDVASLLREVATTKNSKLHPVKDVGFKGLIQRELRLEGPWN